MNSIAPNTRRSSAGFDLTPPSTSRNSRRKGSPFPYKLGREASKPL